MAAWLSEGEEARLLARVGGGDAQAADALLAPYRPLLASLARRMCGALAAEDLIQAGYVGMLRAARRYDPALAVRFATYAVPWALGEMKRALRQALDATGAYDKRRRIAREEEALRTQLGRSPSARELARGCGMSDWELVQALAASAPESLDADGEAPALEERVAGGEIDVDAVDLRLALDRLGEEERRLILLRYFRDHTQKETARVLGKSQAQVCRIERRALDALRALLTAPS